MVSSDNLPEGIPSVVYEGADIQFKTTVSVYGVEQEYDDIANGQAVIGFKELDGQTVTGSNILTATNDSVYSDGSGWFTFDIPADDNTLTEGRYQYAIKYIEDVSDDEFIVKYGVVTVKASVFD